MARGPASPAPNPLPKVSFTKIEDRLLEQPAGVHDQQARSYGCMVLKIILSAPTNFILDNDFSSFQRPESYIRYIGTTFAARIVLSSSSRRTSGK